MLAQGGTGGACRPTPVLPHAGATASPVRRSDPTQQDAVTATGAARSSADTEIGTSVTMVSAKVGKASKKHPNPTLKLKLSAAKGAVAGSVSVTVTETGGTSTAVGTLGLS